MPKNIILDLGGVMINYDPTEYIETFPYPKELKAKLYDAIFHDDTWMKSDYGIYPTYQDMVPIFVCHHPELKDEIEAFFNPKWLDVYSILPNGESLFNQLYEKGYDIYILTNFFSDGFNTIYRKYDFFKKVKGCVVSSFEKTRKPEDKIYHTLLERYHLNPEDCLFIDDNLENVRAAIKNSIPSYFYQGYEACISYLKKEKIL